MKKIGIVTFSNSYNYGAILQSIALYNLLSFNNEVFFVNYSNKYENMDHKLICIKKNKGLIFNCKNVINNIFFSQHYYLRKAFDNFIRNYRFTKKYTIKTIDSIDSDYGFDCIVLGSDQLWNPMIYDNALDPVFLLDFFTNSKKISYATSIGSCTIEKKYENIYKNSLLKYSHISVRELFAKNELFRIGLEDVSVVCDPTMLLSKNEWEKYITNNFIYKDYILVYLIGPYKQYENYIRELKKKLNKEIVLVSFSNMKRKYVDHYARGVDPSEFLGLIKNASYIITNSFHGTVFSIIFNKRFIHLENKSNPIRCKELLSTFNITNCIYNNSFEEVIKSSNMINYDLINKKLNQIRIENRKWLFDAINN